MKPHPLDKVYAVQWDISVAQLDAGSEESVILHAQDEQSVLVVSYMDLKACLETTFSQVLASSKWQYHVYSCHIVLTFYFKVIMPAFYTVCFIFNC